MQELNQPYLPIKNTDNYFFALTAHSEIKLKCA
jgi:hypothetical protein